MAHIFVLSSSALSNLLSWLLLLMSLLCFRCPACQMSTLFSLQLIWPCAVPLPFVSFTAHDLLSLASLLLGTNHPVLPGYLGTLNFNAENGIAPRKWNGCYPTYDINHFNIVFIQLQHHYISQIDHQWTAHLVCSPLEHSGSPVEMCLFMFCSLLDELVHSKESLFLSHSV